MESGPTTSWQINGETMETMTDFIFLGSKITADGDLWPCHFSFFFGFVYFIYLYLIN